MPTRHTHYLNGEPKEKFPRARSRGAEAGRLVQEIVGPDTGCDTWVWAFNAHEEEDAALGLQEVDLRVRDPLTKARSLRRLFSACEEVCSEELYALAQGCTNKFPTTKSDSKYGCWV